MLLETIDRESVITVYNSNQIFLLEHSTFRLSELLREIRTHSSRNYNDMVWKWILDGVPCELLQPNQEWQKGTIKLALTFTPDKAEEVTSVTNDGSVLEELRQISAH